MDIAHIRREEPFLQVVIVRLPELRRVLLIDDDPHVNEVIRATLEMLGHQVTTVESANTALEVSAEFKPDVALVDYNLPGRSGLEVMQDLAAQNPAMIRYFATGMADFALLQSAVAAGANSMLCKPYRMSDLISLMETAKLLDAALRQERATADCAAQPDLSVRLNDSPADDAVLLSNLIGFARNHAADADIAERRLPVTAVELIKNARAHGACPYRLHISDEGGLLMLRVCDGGAGFDWRKALATARACMDKGRASGLQLVAAMADGFAYEQNGREACVQFRKYAAGRKAGLNSPDESR